MFDSILGFLRDVSDKVGNVSDKVGDAFSSVFDTQSHANKNTIPTTTDVSKQDVTAPQNNDTQQQGNVTPPQSKNTIASISTAPVAESNTTANQESPQSGQEKVGFWRAYIRASADQGHAPSMGIQARFFPEDYKKRESRKEIASRLQELMLKQSETNLARSKWELEQKKQNASLVNAQLEQNLRNSQLQVKQAAQNLESSKKSEPYRLQRLATDAEAAKFRLQQAKHAVWDANLVQAQNKYIDNFKEKVGYNQWNKFGQATFDNSKAVKAFGQLSYMMQLAQRDPEQYQYMLEKIKGKGWEPGNDDKGELTLTHNNLDGQKYQFVANDAGLKKLSETIQTKLKDNLTTAKIIGTDAATMGQATAKTLLTNPAVQQVFGDNAYREYSNFFNRKVMDKKNPGEYKDVFSPEDKTYHMLNVSLGAALEDNQFNAEEQRVLLPQVQRMIKYLGGELQLGDSVENTKVVWGRDRGYAQTYSIKDFLHTVLREKDVITPAFGDYMRSVAQRGRRIGGSAGLGVGEDGSATPMNENRETRISQAGSMYGSLFKDADDKKQNHIISVMDNFYKKTATELKNKNVSNYKELGLDVLRQLDDYWNDQIDDKKFYSPVQDEIFLRERDDLYAQKAPLIQELRESEKSDDIYRKEYYRPRDWNSKKTRELRRKVNRINDAIKMREKKLKERGIQFKEYK
jgi:hypothetical protein